MYTRTTGRWGGGEESPGPAVLGKAEERAMADSEEKEAAEGRTSRWGEAGSGF